MRRRLVQSLLVRLRGRFEFVTIVRAMFWLVGILRWLLRRPRAPRPEAGVSPAKATPPTSTPARGAVQDLWCEPGQHQWRRPAVSGRKPRACPQYRLARAPAGG